MRVTWSVHAVDTATDEVLVDERGDTTLPCASVGKVLVLIEAARRFTAGTLDPTLPLTRAPREAVADSGLWQHLATDSLPAADLCVLVGAVSDNLATNVLLRTLGLDAVQDTARELRLGDVALHDKVRDHRGPKDPPQLATASARALAHLFARLHRGELVSPAVSTLVRGWLAGNTDLSMVAAAWSLDPLAHRPADAPPIELVSKTGTDAGVRSDAGAVVGHGRTVAYAALAHWASGPAHRTAGTTGPPELPHGSGASGAPGQPDLAPQVLARMREIGADLLSLAAAAR